MHKIGKINAIYEKYHLNSEEKEDEASEPPKPFPRKSKVATPPEVASPVSRYDLGLLPDRAKGLKKVWKPIKPMQRLGLLIAEFRLSLALAAEYAYIDGVTLHPKGN